MHKKIIYFIICLIAIFTLISCNEETESNPIYAVTFYNDQGEVIHITTVEEGKAVVEPTPPNKIGHQFIGWEPSLENINQNLNVFPIYEKQTYQLVIHDMDRIETISILYDDQITLPTPHQEGFQFINYYLDQEYKIPLNYMKMPNFDLTLYIQYEPMTYQISFDHDAYDTLLVPYLALIELIEIDIEGQAFSGFYLDPSYEVPFELENMPNYDVIIYPKYEPIFYIIDFITNSEIDIDQQIYQFNDTLDIPDLEKDDLIFLGWYLDEALKLPFDLLLMPSYHLTLYAKWEAMTPNFIRRVGDQLYLGDEVFRFVSFNIPNLHILEDPDWHMADPFEQDDALHSVKLMGGQVARIYTLSIIGGIRPMEKNNELAHIMGIETYNEELFKSLDKVIELAGKYGIYLIIPFIDEWNWFGGIAEFSALYGQSRNAFFTNSAVKNGFKHLMSYVLNRVNTYTGIPYKDDPNILAFELGNELRSAPNAWINEMALYFKSIDQNHLLMSGRDEVTTNDLNNPNIDIINAHYYTNNGTGTFASRARRDRNLTKDIKPFIIGEYGLVSYDEIEAMIIESVENGTTGSLIWSLRFRNVNGGFYYHNDDPTRSYHYPGFDINNDYDEEAIIDLITYYAHYVQGVDVIPPPIPRAPVLFDILDASITWQGQTGSKSFIIERRIFGQENWLVIASDISDAYESGPFFIDLEGQNGVLYEYRVIAVNTSGLSLPSNTVLYLYQKPIENVNLALNQMIEVSSSENDQGMIRSRLYAIDGDYQTRWSSLYEDHQWLEIIFSNVYEITIVKIYFEAAYARQYRLLGSIDRNDYFLIYEDFQAQGGLVFIELEPTDVLYLKLELIQRATQWGFSIYEIEVY
jgi:hypothetical protein